jgi:hypothetical protein
MRQLRYPTNDGGAKEVVLHEDDIVNPAAVAIYYRRIERWVLGEGVEVSQEEGLENYLVPRTENDISFIVIKGRAY